VRLITPAPAVPVSGVDIETALATMCGLALLRSVSGARDNVVERRWVEARKRLERMLSAS
jgi:hypothetical protein